MIPVPAHEERPGTRCPECGGRSVPLLFGFPGDDARDAYEQGLIALGGCDPGVSDPPADRECLGCSAWFLGPRPR